MIEAPLGDRICLIDGDTFFVNGIDDVWDRDFDLAYTVRDFIIPFNGGVVFVRVTPRTQEFMERWRQVNAAMYHDVSYHMKWKEKYGGLNQASFGCLLEDGHGLDLLTLPCTEWNCEDSCWGAFDPARTRIVHVKSGLRRLIFQGDVGPPQEPWWTNDDLMPLARRWHALERAARQAEVHDAVSTYFNGTAPPPAGAAPPRDGRCQGPRRAGSVRAFPSRPPGALPGRRRPPAPPRRSRSPRRSAPR